MNFAFEPEPGGHSVQLLRQRLKAMPDKPRKVLLVVLTFLRGKELSGNAGNFNDFPYGALSIATYCKKQCGDRVTIEVLDLAPTDADQHGHLALLENKLQLLQPDVVGFSVMFDNAYRFVKPCAELVRSTIPMAVVVGGGSALSAAFQGGLKEISELDAICYSEGEIPFTELLLAEDMRQLLADHPSWVTRNSLTEERVPAKTSVDPLDDVVNVDYSFINSRNYETRTTFVPVCGDMTGGRQFPLVSSRGCPFSCRFCWHSGEDDRSMRYASVEKVLDHVEYLVRDLGMDTLAFYDDQILFNKTRAKKLFEGLARFGLRIECPNGLSVSYMDEELIELMYKAGVRAARLAVESGSPYVLRTLMRKPVKLEKVKQVVDILRRWNFWVIGFFVIGMPGETEDHRKETVRFMRETGFDWVLVSPAIPSKGSALWKECREKGYIEDETNFHEYSSGTTYINTPEFTSEYILERSAQINLEVNFVNNHRMAVGDFAVAASYFRYVADTYRDHAFAHYYLGQALRRAGDPGADAMIARAKTIADENEMWRDNFRLFSLSF